MAQIPITLNLELDLDKINIESLDGLELPSYAVDILLKMLARNIHAALQFNPGDSAYTKLALEAKGYREALIEFSQHFNNPELPNGH